MAPSPTGLLHLGHAHTFWMAYRRAVEAGGTLVLRNEDLDPRRSRPEFTRAMLEDLYWLGIRWQEGPSALPPHLDAGDFGPYAQSERLAFYLEAFRALLGAGWLYPCTCSRRELAAGAQVPHEGAGGEAEGVYPGTCRRELTGREIATVLDGLKAAGQPPAHTWRFRIPPGDVTFTDSNPMFGGQSFTAGVHFGDFAVWRRDGVPAYQLACVVDDAAMRITEVVRGADLLLSTARQILLQRALNLATPGYFHCPLVLDASGERLAKRSDAVSIRALRERGATPESLRPAPLL